uniref:Leucine-rich repeat-containing protein 41 n=1 Tax=Scophthalmus maximus TaxID=52904 RepID=A0A8D3CP93_SCOMX
MRRAEPTNVTQTCLKEICLRAVRKHFSALDFRAVLDLPAPLIRDLLPHLTVCQLDELQPELNQRGISTHSGWAGILQDMYGPNYEVDLHTEERAKHEVMSRLFTLVFYGFTNHFVERNITNLSTSSFLWAAAKCIKHFLLNANFHKPLQRLTAEQQPLLNLLEKHIRSVAVVQSIDVSKRKTQTSLYILHRLLDHGMAKKLVVDVRCPIALAWLLHGRGSQDATPELKSLMLCKRESSISQAAAARADIAGCSAGRETRASEDEDDPVIPFKRSMLDSASQEEESGNWKPGPDFTVDPQVLCRTFSPCDDHSAGACTWGQIDCLEIRECRSVTLRVLNSALPTFFCLRSLTLHSSVTLRESDVLGLARALKQLSESSRSCLTFLNIGVLPNAKLTEMLLDACPKVTSLHVEIQTMMWGTLVQAYHPRTAESDKELPLEKLTVKVAGIRLPTGSSLSQLLTTISESNTCLRSLNLEDMKLSDCLPEIHNLLRDCKLEELRCNDCRLHECSDTEHCLQQLVVALKTVPSLHTLSLARNRLACGGAAVALDVEPFVHKPEAKNVCVLAELFSGPSPSTVKWLDISSNFIRPAELLELAHRLSSHRPPQRLVLDLRRNPGDRDPDTWNAALNKLRPLCALLVGVWKSSDTMVDHISNM